MTKFCGQVSIPTVNNTVPACPNFYDTDCVIFQDPIAYFGTSTPTSSTDVFNLIISSLQDARSRVTALEGVSSIGVDLVPTDGSTNAVESNGIFDALALKANDADVVKLTGNQTAAGVKTFSSGIIVPADPYGVSWDGNLSAPTKDDIYDKIEALVLAGGATWGGINGTLSNQLDLQAALALKANDSEVVHLTGAETIAGIKTFTDITWLQGQLIVGSNTTPILFTIRKELAPVTTFGSVDFSRLYAAPSGALGWGNGGTSNLWELTNSNTAKRVYTWPDKDGTVAMLDDIAASKRSYVDSTGNGLTGVQNGVNQVFTVSQSAYDAGSILAFVGGIPLAAGNGLTETTPGSGIITFDDPPIVSDVIIIQYSN